MPDPILHSDFDSTARSKDRTSLRIQVSFYSELEKAVAQELQTYPPNLRSMMAARFLAAGFLALHGSTDPRFGHLAQSAAGPHSDHGAAPSPVAEEKDDGSIGVLGGIEG